MATDATIENFDRYNQLAREYRECMARCQQTLDQLQACRRDLGDFANNIADASDHCQDATTAWFTPPLSNRELQVFTLIGQGLTTQQIAAQIGISTSTIETYRERLKTKLNVDSAAALVRRAVLWLVGPRLEDQA